MAIDLTTSWKIIHEQSLYRTNTKLRIYAKVKSQSIANNSTVVATWMGIYISDSVTYTTTSCTGHVSGAGDFSYSNKNFPANTETYLSGGEFTASHNADGTGRTYCTWWLSQTYGGSVAYTESTWLNLPAIPRTSNVSVSNSNMTAGSTYTVNTNRKSTAFTHTITYSFGNASGTIGTNVADGVSWTPPTSLLAQIPNSNSGTGTITCVTYNGSTQVGTSTCGFTLNIPSGSNPSMSSQSVTEQNSKVSAKGTSITVQQISSKKVSVVVSAKYSASITRVTCNGVSLSNSNGTWSATLSNLSTGTYTFTALDSRGLSSTVTVSQTYYSYNKPSISGSLARESQTGSTGTLSVTGAYANILSNTVTMTYERKVNGNSEGGSSVTPTISSGNVSYSRSYSDLYYTNSYQVVVTITDAFDESASIVISLGQGQYALFLGKNKIISPMVKTNRIEGLPHPANSGIGWGNICNLVCKNDWDSGTQKLVITGCNITTAVTIFISNGNHTGTSWSDWHGAIDCHCDDRLKFKVAFEDSICRIWMNEQWNKGRTVQFSTDGNCELVEGDKASQASEPAGNYLCSYVLYTTYPIGTVWQDYLGTRNPNTLFGGSWTRLNEDRVLLASSSANSYGGENSHTLSWGEMPVHDHGMNMGWFIGGWSGTAPLAAATFDNPSRSGYSGQYGNWTNRYTTDNGLDLIQTSGSGSAHNNMMAYRTVATWVRTA